MQIWSFRNTSIVWCLKYTLGWDQLLYVRCCNCKPECMTMFYCKTQRKLSAFQCCYALCLIYLIFHRLSCSCSVWPSLFDPVASVTCCSCRCVSTAQCFMSPTGGCVDIAEFLSVLKQILSAFCQISRHVSAVISTPRSFSHICLVARVITQVVAGNQYQLIFWRGMTICVCLWRREWPIKLNGASKNEVWDKVQPVFEAEMIGRHLLLLPLKTEWHNLVLILHLETRYPFKPTVYKRF